jgi:hypothetical protein
MNAVEIEEAVSKLAEAPFDAEAFPSAFLEAFGNKETHLQSPSAFRDDIGQRLSRRDCVGQPRVVAQRLPWVKDHRKTFTPKRLRNGGATLRNPFGVDRVAAAITQRSPYAALRGNLGPPSVSPSGYFDYRNFLRPNARKADGLYIGRRFKNDTERLEKLFELYTQMTAGQVQKKPTKRRTKGTGA